MRGAYRSKPKRNIGDLNSQAKVTSIDVELIRDSFEYRDRRIAEIDAKIEKLKQERIDLRANINHKQYALKFDISEPQVARIIRFKSWRTKQ